MSLDCNKLNTRCFYCPPNSLLFLLYRNHSSLPQCFPNCWSVPSVCSFQKEYFWTWLSSLRPWRLVHSAVCRHVSSAIWCTSVSSLRSPQSSPLQMRQSPAASNVLTEYLLRGGDTRGGAVLHPHRDEVISAFFISSNWMVRFMSHWSQLYFSLTEVWACLPVLKSF
jgi:hypothetical protein